MPWYLLFFSLVFRYILFKPFLPPRLERIFHDVTSGVFLPTFASLDHLPNGFDKAAILLVLFAPAYQAPLIILVCTRTRAQSSYCPVELEVFG
jgi:hypothetical protein